jgi:hypothetical protein
MQKTQSKAGIDGVPNRRLVELAAAVREHEASVRRSRPLGVRAQDDVLYRRLRQICGG